MIFILISRIKIASIENVYTNFKRGKMFLEKCFGNIIFTIQTLVLIVGFLKS